MHRRRLWMLNVSVPDTICSARRLLKPKKKPQTRNACNNFTCTRNAYDMAWHQISSVAVDAQPPTNAKKKKRKKENSSSIWNSERDKIIAGFVCCALVCALWFVGRHRGKKKRCQIHSSPTKKCAFGVELIDDEHVFLLFWGFYVSSASHSIVIFANVEPQRISEVEGEKEKTDSLLLHHGSWNLVLFWFELVSIQNAVLCFATNQIECKSRVISLVLVHIDMVWCRAKCDERVTM